MAKIRIGDYSMFKLHQEKSLEEDKAMLKGLNDTVLHHWTRNQKDWVLKNLNFRLEKEFKLTENSILSIKEWEEAKTKERNAHPTEWYRGNLQGYEEWLANNPKYISVQSYIAEKEGA